MSYDDIEIEDMEWNEELKAFTYMCPCGDLFQITKVVTTASGLPSTAAAPNHICDPNDLMQEELAAGEEIAHCPSCSLYITVVYDPVRAWQSGRLSFGCKIECVASDEVLPGCNSFDTVSGGLSRQGSTSFAARGRPNCRCIVCP